LEKELSIAAENGTVGIYGNLNRKKRKILKEYSDKCQRIRTFDRDSEGKSVNKSTKILKI